LPVNRASLPGRDQQQARNGGAEKHKILMADARIAELPRTMGRIGVVNRGSG